MVIDGQVTQIVPITSNSIIIIRSAINPLQELRQDALTH